MSARPRRLRAGRLAALCAAAALSAAGCGGQVDDSAASAAAAVATVATAAAAPLIVDPAPQAVPAVRNDEAGDIRSQLMLLRAEVAQLRQRLEAMSASAGPVSSLPVAAESAGDEATEARRLAATEAAFRGEAVEHAWSQAVAMQLRAAITQSADGFGDRVRSVECRSQTCRVEMAADGVLAFEDQLALIAGPLAQALPHAITAMVDQGNGQQAAVVYLSR